MIPSLEATGWGRGAQDPSPPLALEGPAARRARELFVHLLVEALQSWRVGQHLVTVFGLPPPEQTDAYAAFVRLLTLLDRLFHRELPRVRRAVRCENLPEEGWMVEPRGGRLDPIGTLRRPEAALAPHRWRVIRGRRVAATAPNRVAAAILHEAVRRLRVARAELRAAGVGLRRDLDFAGLGLRKLRRFLAGSPLGELAPEPLDPALLREARRRPGAWRRIAPLHAWWRELQAVDLRALAAAEAPERALSIHDAYEAVVALSLILALNERFGAPDADDRGLRFHTGAGELRLGLGRHPQEGRRGRPPTALIELRDARGARGLVLEARNAASESALDVLDRLDLLVQAGVAQACWLVTPTPLDAPTRPPCQTLVFALGPRADRASALAAWAPLLDTLSSLGGTP